MRNLKLFCHTDYQIYEVIKDKTFLSGGSFLVLEIESQKGKFNGTHYLSTDYDNESFYEFNIFKNDDGVIFEDIKSKSPSQLLKKYYRKEKFNRLLKK